VELLGALTDWRCWTERMQRDSGLEAHTGSVANVSEVDPAHYGTAGFDLELLFEQFRLR